MAQTSGESDSRCSNGTLGSNSCWTALCEEVVPCGDGLGPESPTDLVWQKRLVKMSHLCLQTAAVPRAQTSACPLSSILTQDLDLLSALQTSSTNREPRLEQREVERVVFEISDCTQEQMEGGERVKKLLLSSSLSSVWWLHCNEVNIYAKLLSRSACSLSNS